MKCKRDGCDDHDVIVGMKTFPYCTNLCAAIDVPARASLGTAAVADTEPPDVAPSPVNVEVLAAADEPVLPTDSDERKDVPIFSGVMNYFPLALAAVARLSKRGNDKHNPGEPLHWARGKSMDHPDCIARHLLDYETQNPETGEYEDAEAMAWRALALLQELEEKRLGKPWSRGSR